MGEADAIRVQEEALVRRRTAVEPVSQDRRAQAGWGGAVNAKLVCAPGEGNEFQVGPGTVPPEDPKARGRWPARP